MNKVFRMSSKSFHTKLKVIVIGIGTLYIHIFYATM